MLFFLYGPDTYRLKQKLQELLKDYQEKPHERVHFQYFNIGKQGIVNERNQTLSFEEFKKEISNISLFKERKIIILYNLFNLPEFKKKFLKQLKEFLRTQNIIFICQEGETDKEDELFKFLTEKAKIYQFKILKGLKLKRWLQREFEKQRISITSDALEELIFFTGGDTWQLSNEVKKLVSFKKDKKEPIQVQDIEKLVRPRVEINIFQTIDAIAQKDKKRALRLIHYHLEKGDSALYLFSMIHFQFRNLLLVRDLMEKGKPLALILKEISLHPLVIKKSFAQARNFSFQQLKRIYQKIFQLDFQIKIGKLKPETALELFIAQI